MTESAQRSKKNAKNKVNKVKSPDKKISRFSFLTIPDSLRNQKFPLYLDSKRFGFVCQIQRIRVDGSRIRKGKVADSKVPGYVWTRLAEKRLYWAAKTLDYIFLRFLSRIGVIFLQAHGLWQSFSLLTNVWLAFKSPRVRNFAIFLGGERVCEWLK